MISVTPFPSPRRILHLEDSAADALLINSLLAEEWPDCRVSRVAVRSEFRTALELADFDLILSDYSLPDFDGLKALEMARTWCPDKPFIFMSGTIGEERAIEALQRGASDYIIKDRPSRLIPAIQAALTRAAETARRRRTEEALRENQERFRQITENVADMIAVLDLEGRRVYNNPAYRSILGDPEALRGTLSFNEIHPEDRERIRAIFAETVQTGIGRRAEYRFLLPDGSVRHIESQGSVIRDARGNLANVLVVSRDISGRLADQLRLRDQAALLDKARDAIIATGIDNRITYWNASAERLYGWSAAEAIGQSLPELGLGFEPARFRAARDHLQAHGEWRGYFTLQAKAGHTVLVDSTWSLVLADNGQPRAILVIDTDITEKKKLETQLLQAQRVESIGTLTGGVAHDLNNVLTPILMGAELLRLQLTDPAERKLIDTMDASARHGVDLIKQLLTFARGAASDRSEVRLPTLLTELDPLIRQTLRGKIQCEVAVAPGTSPVLADATQLKQVILNLCINARDAMPSGGRVAINVENVMVDGQLRRRATDGKSGPHVRITVADTGTGIPQHLLEKIFDPFFTTKEIGKGTGLGLSTVHGIVQGHEGFLNVESEVGRGTTFAIYLPALTEPPPAPATPAPVQSPGGQGETILVVEEDDYVRMMTTSFLEHHRYRVLGAGDGREGLELFRTQAGSVAAVITNLVLPQINGPELIAALRVLQPGVRVIGLIGSGKSGGRPGNLDERSVAAILPKPVDVAQLLNTLRQVLGAGTDAPPPAGR